MHARTKRFFINFTILILSIFVSIFVAETLCRFFISKESIFKGHHALFCKYDSLLGWKNRPNVKRGHKTDEYSVIECMNSKGIRGPEYSYEKDKDKYRILILGDSFAEGYTVQFNELFSEVLKDRLKNKGINFEVINTGTGGYSTDQELLFFQNEGKKYSPELVILMFCENDVWYNIRPTYWRGYKPLFKYIDNELILTNVPVPKQAIYKTLTPGANSNSFFLNIKIYLAENSYLYNLIKDRVKNVHYLYVLAIKFGLAEKPPNIKPTGKCDQKVALVPDEFKIWCKEYSPEIAEAWKMTELLIIKLQEEVNFIGSRLLVFYVPPRGSIYTEVWKDTKRKYGISDDWSIEQSGIKLESICKRNNIDLINPIALFKAEADKLKTEGKRLYFVKDGHWNVNGHKFAGETLADFINFNYLVIKKSSRH